jgi:Zn-dependent peptidase ImmA (M78 family)/transcriptional regulator with XRE-family HTH domain
MAISQEELGRRLRAAREACGMRQAQVAEALKLSRPTVAQLELDRLAHLYGRDIRDFLSEQFAEQDAVTALFRAEEGVPDAEEVAARLRECIAVRRELSQLESLLAVDRHALAPATYAWPPPKSRWEAIRQGERAAIEERRRLGLGFGPAPDLVDLFDGEGIRCALLTMPPDVSGVTVFDKNGPFVVVNHDHPVLRRRFSFAHELAHVLLDREGFGAVSRHSNRKDLLEMRANAFAAAFLMPEEGVREAVASLGKGQPSRASAEVFDGAEAFRVEARAAPGTQDIQLYDVVQVAHHFRVSHDACLYRLQNLKLLTTAQATALREADQGRGKLLAKRLGLRAPDDAHEKQWFRRRFLGRALEAFRREIISRRKLDELGALVELDHAAMERLLDAAGLAETSPVDPLLPSG